MPRPENLLRLLVEFVFILLGGMLLWSALTGRYFGRFDRRSTGWIALGCILVIAGLAAMLRGGKVRTLMEDRIRGISLALVGVVMLVLAVAPFGYVAPLLGVAGAALVLRGLASSVLVLRHS